MKFLVINSYLILVISLTSNLVLANDPKEPHTFRGDFCLKNPDAKICKNVFDVRKDEKKELDEYCRFHPNTEKCKNKKTVENVRKERLNFCSENPKACAARR